ncbi:hypothetical protein [Streptomyces sp. Ac-502]|uniref:hypothetical protein n=1 Tax=Streptomyces sp. Ac-502 TaxID=3342801 RepID=UPI00386237C3
MTLAESVGAILGDQEVLRRVHSLAEQVPAWDAKAMLFHVSNRTRAAAEHPTETLAATSSNSG